MKAMVISYSLTGNNDALAASLAAALAAEHVRIVEAGSRTMGRILLDLMFNRTPKVRLPVEKTGGYDVVLFVGPVWMGQVATPLRACFRRLGPEMGRYAFVSISGGADGPNPKLADELGKRLGKEPLSVVDLHIADLLPREPKPVRRETSAYRLGPEEVKRLTETARTALQKDGVLAAG